MPDNLFMSADEVADALDVSVSTVYTYVSRGLIRSQRTPGSKSRRYWRSDVEKLAPSPTPPAILPLPQRLVSSTAITLITEFGHYYRGHSALELSAHATLETTASILWQAPEAQVFDGDLPTIPTSVISVAKAERDLIRAAIGMLFAAEQANPRAFDLSPAGYRRSGADVLRCMIAAIVGADAPSTAPAHIFIADKLRTPARYVDIIRRMLVLAADHQLDPTTYAVRAAANTGVTPFSVAIAGLITSSGRRLTFGQSASVGRLLDEISEAADPSDPILRRVREGEALPGFASKNYPKGDPRARSLMDELHRHCGDDQLVKRLEIAASAALDAVGAQPDFVLPALLIGRQAGMKGDQRLLIRIARTAGWVAHAMEQFHGNELVRPHAPYNGPLPNSEEALR